MTRVGENPATSSTSWCVLLLVLLLVAASGARAEHGSAPVARAPAVQIDEAGGRVRGVLAAAAASPPPPRRFLDAAPRWSWRRCVGRGALPPPRAPDA